MGISSAGYNLFRGYGESGLERFIDHYPPQSCHQSGTVTVHTYHLHLAEMDHPVLLRPLRFRDYLRRHPDRAEKYAEIQRELAKRCGQDIFLRKSMQPLQKINVMFYSA